jgi:hypothetical protein
MRICRSVFTAALLATLSSATLLAQQPPGVSESLATLGDQPATHTSFTFDRSMMQIAEGLMEQNGVDAKHATAALNSVTVETYHYPRPVFYTPEVMQSIIHNYNAAGWKHLVNANASPAPSAHPTTPVTVLLRAQKNMNVIEVSGLLRPLDLVHLSGHFGIPKVDPNAVMVPAAPGR